MLFLQKPRDLLGQEQHKCYLHHLRRANLKGNAGEFQPGVVSRLLRANPQRRDQKRDKHHVKGQYPFPFLHNHLQIHHRDENIHPDPQKQRRGLNNHSPHPFFRRHVPGGAEDQYQTVQRSGTAQPQQQQVRLLDKVYQDCFQSIQHKPLPFH